MAEALSDWELFETECDQKGSQKMAMAGGKKLKELCVLA